MARLKHKFNSIYSMLLLITLFFQGYKQTACADFIQTSNYFQAEDGFARIIPTESGLYFIIPANQIPIQEFVLKNITEGLDAFLKYDKNLNRYTDLYTGTRHYHVRGSFSLKINNIIIKVDNYANPYCTVETSSSKKDPAIIAFQGVTAVANYSGRSAVAVLSANQVFENISGIHPYVLNEKNELLLNGNLVSEDFIGLDIQIPESPCLINSDSIVFLSAAELNSIKQNKDNQARKKELQEAIKKNKVNVLKDLILLKAAKSIIAFDPRDSTIKAIRLVNNEPKICEIENVELG